MEQNEFYCCDCESDFVSSDEYTLCPYCGSSEVDRRGEGIPVDQTYW